MPKRDFYGNPMGEAVNAAGDIAVEWFRNVLSDNMSTSTSTSGQCPNLSQTTTRTQTSILDAIGGSSETIDAKRLPPSKYRLHPAKYVPNMGNFLGDLFMSTLTSRLNFGFTSNTGNSMELYHKTGATNTGVPAMAPRGNYRGISFLKFRFTDPTVNRKAVNALNAIPVKLLGSTDSQTVFSCYREFNNCPKLTNAGGASVVQSSAPYLFQADAATTQGAIRQLGVGMNLAHFENHAYQSSNFIQSQAANAINGTSGLFVSPAGQPPVGTVSNSHTNIGTNGYDNLPDAGWDGAVETDTSGVIRGILQGNGTSASPYNYPTTIKDAVMRIQDGYVEFDITNTAKTAAVIEIVMHSMRKCEQSSNTPELYSEIWNAYDYQVQQQVNTNDVAPNANSIGGWQTFYDPDIPLLSLKSSAAKKVTPIAREVHRSNHVLGSGQSKCVKVALGSLYYSLGGKSETPTGATEYVLSKRDNPGCIAVAIGHTGFESIETLVPPGSTAKSNQIGSGLWAGKQRSPSSICVSGKYEEKYYPMYMHSNNRIMGNNHPLRASYIVDPTTNAEQNLPTGQLPTNHVTITEDSDLMRDNGAGAVEN